MPSRKPMYDTGQDVPQDHAEAVRWYRLAAERGNASAQHNLGYLYANGIGVPQHYETGHMWFNIAAANGFDAAVEARDAVAGRMTAAAIAEAQCRARLCMTSGYADCD